MLRIPMCKPGFPNSNTSSDVSALFVWKLAKSTTCYYQTSVVQERVHSTHIGSSHNLIDNILEYDALSNTFHF
jgi:hypothetical protein